MKTIAFRAEDELSVQIKVRIARKGVSLQTYLTDLVLKDIENAKKENEEKGERITEDGFGT